VRIVGKSVTARTERTGIGTAFAAQLAGGERREKRGCRRAADQEFSPREQQDA
jgi:hypothetical protein